MAGFALLGAALSFGDEYASTWVGERFTLALRAKLFGHLQRLEPDALDRRRHGDVLARLTGDLHAIETLLLNALAEAVQAAARLLFFAGALFLLSWKLALASPDRDPAAVLGREAVRHAGPPRRARAPPAQRLASAPCSRRRWPTPRSCSPRTRRAASRSGCARENEGAVAAELAGTRVAGLFAPVIDLIELARRDPDHRARDLGAEHRRPDARRPARVPRLPLAALPPAARPLAPVPAGLRGHRRRGARDRADGHRSRA